MRVPASLIRSLGALFAATGVTVGGGWMAYDHHKINAQNQEFVEAVANDTRTSLEVKVAMVAGAHWESSNRHIGTPYIDKVGKGNPLTVCNGVTGPKVVAGRKYTPQDCYELELDYYLDAERQARRMIRTWNDATVFQRASVLDFIYNLGAPALAGSTMLRKANASDWIGACRENTKWVYGTVEGVKKVLSHLVTRRGAEAEMCESWIVVGNAS